MSQLVSKPARGGALLDLLFANREELVGDVVVRVERSNQKMIKFSILGEVRNNKNFYPVFPEDGLCPIYGIESSLGSSP